MVFGCTGETKQTNRGLHASHVRGERENQWRRSRSTRERRNRYSVCSKLRSNHAINTAWHNRYPIGAFRIRVGSPSTSLLSQWLLQDQDRRL